MWADGERDVHSTKATPESLPMSDDKGPKATVTVRVPGGKQETGVRERAGSGRASRLADSAAFLRGFLERPSEVASVVPSSVVLETRVVHAADVAEARCIVELGPGTGGTTRALLRALPPDGRLLAIDVNPGFCARLKREIDDPRLVVHFGSAEALGETLLQHALPAPDAVVSGIPFSTLPGALAQTIAASIHASLAPGGRMVAYQWRPHVARYLTPHFGPPSTTWVWRNVPPMRIFRWLKPGADT
jgi:phosphatidylethanolamine/phosphatidyl-N-methylethanolamine N-methyltransferase